MSAKFVTEDGWQAEVVSLTAARHGKPGNYPVPAGNGEQFAVSYHGTLRGYVRTPAELAQFFPLASLREVM